MPLIPLKAFDEHLPVGMRDLLFSIEADRIGLQERVVAGKLHKPGKVGPVLVREIGAGQAGERRGGIDKRYALHEVGALLVSEVQGGRGEDPHLAVGQLHAAQRLPHLGAAVVKDGIGAERIALICNQHVVEEENLIALQVLHRTVGLQVGAVLQQAHIALQVAHPLLIFDALLHAIHILDEDLPRTLVRLLSLRGPHPTG